MLSVAPKHRVPLPFIGLIVFVEDFDAMLSEACIDSSLCWSTTSIASIKYYFGTIQYGLKLFW